ncbi:MAG: hypothetical protein IPG57_23915 [Burkholderiales bacterium]|nr:hypothetical protein [Burkholderiales bacterium]
MTPARLLLVLKSRWLLVLLVWLGVITLVGLVTALQPRAYTATSVLLVDVKAADPLGTSPAQPGQADAYMAAQMDIIASERVARQVIAVQHLADDPAAGTAGNVADQRRQRWQSDTGGQGDYIAWLSEELRKNLEVRPAKESGVIRIFYTAPDREEAARMANAYVKAYSDTALQLRVEPARQHSNFFDERSRQLRERLEVAQARLSDYQRSNGPDRGGLRGSPGHRDHPAERAVHPADPAAGAGRRIQQPPGAGPLGRGPHARGDRQPEHRRPQRRAVAPAGPA